MQWVDARNARHELDSDTLESSEVTGDGIRADSAEADRREARSSAYAQRLPAIVAAAAGIVAVGFAALSWRDPSYGDALGFYVPYAHALYVDPTNLTFRLVSHPPLPAFLIAAVWHIAGPSLWAPHLVTLSAFAATLGGSFTLARRIGGPWAGPSAVVVIAAVPVLESQARIATPEMVVAAFVVWAAVAASAGRWAVGGALLVGAALSKETSAVLFPVFAVLAAFEPHAATVRERVKHAVLIALPPLVAIGGWAIYYQLATGAYLSGGANPDRQAATPTYIVSRLGSRLHELVVFDGLGPIIVIAAGATLVRWTRRRLDRAPEVWLTALTVIPTIAYLLLHAVAGFPLARYMAPALPVLAAGMVGLVARSGRIILAVGIASTVALGLSQMTRSPGLYRDPEGNLTYRALMQRDEQLTAHVAQLAAADRRPVVSTAPNNGYPYVGELSSPFLGYVTTPVRTVATAAANCGYILISTQKPAGPRVTAFMPRGGAWPSRETRYVSVAGIRRPPC